MLHILFLCTGNTCRSPMAKAIFGAISPKYGINSIFSSAALGFVDGQPVSPNAVTVCNEVGLDISTHKARIIREHDLEVTDIFVVMTPSHAQTLMSIGVPQEKIYILGSEFGGIPDPYGSNLVNYRRCRTLISEAIDEFCKLICVKIYKRNAEESSDGKNSHNENGTTAH